MSLTRKVAAVVAAAGLAVGGYAVGAEDKDSDLPASEPPVIDLPPVGAEPPPATENAPGDVVHVDPAVPEPAEPDEPAGTPGPIAEDPQPAPTQALPPAPVEPPHTTENEPGDVTDKDHSDHHWNDRTLTFIDYTGDKYAAGLAQAVKLWNDVSANVRLVAVDGGEVRRDCGTSGTTGDTIPVCLFSPSDNTVGYASWGFDSSGHTIRGAINIKDGISQEQAARTVPHEVGHIAAFRHGGGCIMEQSGQISFDCGVPSDQDKSELRSIYNHSATGDVFSDPDQCKTLHIGLHETAGGANNKGVSSTSLNELNNQLHNAGCRTTVPPADTLSDLEQCRKLHLFLHDRGPASFRQGVSDTSLNELNNQLHNAGCT